MCRLAFILPILHLGTIVLGFLSASVKQALCAVCEYSNQWRATTASPTARCLTRVEPNGSTHYESNVVCTVPVPLYADSRATVGLVAFSDSVAINGTQSGRPASWSKRIRTPPNPRVS